MASGGKQDNLPRKGQLEVLAHLIFCVFLSRSHVEADIFVLEIPKSIFLV